MEGSIHWRVLVVKSLIFPGKIWYTDGMNTPDHSQPTEQGETCASHPVGRALRLLGDVCTLLIVYALLSGPKRFGELLEAMGNISPKTLSQRLKMLEAIGFVQRQAFLEIPPRVEYRLTEKGLALVDIMEAIKQFGQRYLSEVDPPPPDARSTPPCQDASLDPPPSRE
jgi:DNA-binding HxlR family transcriptional regulator